MSIENCARLLAEKKYENFVVDLLKNENGNWLSVVNVAKNSRIYDLALPREAHVAWLSSPQEDAGYVSIIFYDIESGDSFTAEYNVNRLHLSRAALQ
jgi:hypothetical protein